MSLGGAKTKKPEKKRVAKAFDSSAEPGRKRRMRDSDEEEVETQVDVEMLIGFEGNKTVSLEPKQVKAPLVIPALKNKDWREEAKKKSGGGRYIPESVMQIDGDVPIALNAGAKVTYGLVRMDQKTPDDDTKEVMEVEEIVESVREEVSEESMELDPEKALEQLAMKQILKECNPDQPIATSGPQLVLPMVDNESHERMPISETEAYRMDIVNRPDEATLEDYENIPVEEFGAALLRGMGWKDGQGIGKNKQLTNPIELKMRPSLLGLGAKPMPIMEEDTRKYIKPGETRGPKPKHQSARDFMTSIKRSSTGGRQNSPGQGFNSDSAIERRTSTKDRSPARSSSDLEAESRSKERHRGSSRRDRSPTGDRSSSRRRDRSKDRRDRDRHRERRDRDSDRERNGGRSGR